MPHRCRLSIHSEKIKTTASNNSIVLPKRKKNNVETKIRNSHDDCVHKKVVVKWNSKRTCQGNVKLVEKTANVILGR